MANAPRDVAISFLHLANLDNDIVDRLSRYEAALLRQLAPPIGPVKAAEPTHLHRKGWGSMAPVLHTGLAGLL
jgi:hypothetical protein